MSWSAGSWNQNDGTFYGYPHAGNAGVAPEAVNVTSLWSYRSGTFFNNPFIRTIGVAKPYDSYGSLYYNNVLVDKLYYNGTPVTKCYMDEILVYES